MTLVGAAVALLTLAFVASDALSGASTPCDLMKCECTCCFIAIPNTCDSFCYCGATSSKFAALLECSDGKLFDPSLAICVEKEVYDCSKIPPSGVDCTGLNGGLFPYPGRCENFVQCSNGIEYIFECPSKLHFSKEKKYCDTPENANCQATVLRRQNCQHGQHYPHQHNCSSYYQCSNGYLHTLSCPPGLHWCQHCPEPRCEDPETADCNRKPSGNPLSSITSVTANRVRMSSPLFRQSSLDTREMIACPIPDGLYPVPADPRLYLHCRGSKGAFFGCPPGQEFHQEVNSCLATTEEPIFYLTSERRCNTFDYYNFGR